MKSPNNINSNIVKKRESQRVTITEKGSLGLLALGHKGLKAWRDVRDKKNKNA